MASVKKVAVSMKLGPKFAMEGQVRDHAIRVDQPKNAFGDDLGPTPLEFFFVSIAGCLGTLGRIVANQKRIALRSMEVEVEGDLNVDVLLGRTKEGRSGFTGIRARVKIDADMTPEQKREFLHEVDVRCPVSDNIVNGASLSVELAE